MSEELVDVEMITIKDFMETINYKVTEGSDYDWTCWGDDTFTLDSWNGDNENGYSASITFDTETQVVYDANIIDYKNNRAYRMLNLNYSQAYFDEAASRNVDPNECTDDIQFIDLEVKDDFLEKARAIVNNKPYDTKTTVSLDLPNDELLKYMLMAHEQDMKFNDFIHLAIKGLISRSKFEDRS